MEKCLGNCLKCTYFWLTLEAKKSFKIQEFRSAYLFFDKLCFIVFVLSTSGLFCRRDQIRRDRFIMCWCCFPGSREGKVLNYERCGLSSTIWRAAETGLAWSNRKLQAVYSAEHRRKYSRRMMNKALWVWFGNQIQRSACPSKFPSVA